eukprot:12435764-Alexandrium_andersonii.AAC.1
MSASLVGSEMCIRDSCEPKRNTMIRGPYWNTRMTPTRTQWEFERNPIAVSYTHLTLPTICSV